jgi:ATPase subunit of ABC transporter with duplicated ATPase domains
VVVTHDRYFLHRAADSIIELDRGRCHTYPGNYTTYLATKAARQIGGGRRDVRRRQRLHEELAWITTRATEQPTRTNTRIRGYEQHAAAAERTPRPEPDEIHIPTGPRLGDVVVEVEHLSKTINGSALIDDLSFTLPRGAIAGLIGPNGSGKTTLLRLLAGVERADSGRIRVGDTVHIAYVDQNRAAIDSDRAAWQLVCDGADSVRLDGVDLPSRAYLAKFGFRGDDQTKPPRAMSGGERNRLNLALTLARGGNLLLLDEPTNDLDIEALSGLERALDTFPGCVMVSTHDRWFLHRVATHILAWEGTPDDSGRWRWFSGNFSAYQTIRPEPQHTAEAPAATVHRRLTRS